MKIVRREQKDYPALFAEWRKLGRKIADLGDAVQNDPAEFPLTQQQKREWWANAKARQAELVELIEETVETLKK